MTEAQLPTSGYDIIGDVHGCADQLVALLIRLGYQQRLGVWQHPQRKAVFLGDIFDRGPQIKAAIELIQRIVAGGHGYMVLGNHEYNALAYCTPISDDAKQGYLRPHTTRNRQQIEATLEQFKSYPQAWRATLAWLQQLPLYLDFGHFRVVHACWDSQLIAQLSSQTRLTNDFLAASVQPGSLAYRAVNILLKGTELSLPAGLTMQCGDGVVRRRFRTKFWPNDMANYGDVVFQPDELPAEVANRPLSAAEKRQLVLYDSQQPPLFIGHYWRSGQPSPITSNIACLDYSAVKGGRLVAYRMDQEKVLTQDKLVWVKGYSLSP
jgi:hypothetical protein